MSDEYVTRAEFDGAMKRIDTRLNAISDEGKTIVAMATDIKYIRHTIDDLKMRVTELEKRPHKRYEQWIGAIIGVVVTGVLGVIMAGIMANLK